MATPTRSSNTGPVDERLEKHCCCNIFNGVFAGAGARLPMLLAATPWQALGKCSSRFGFTPSISLSVCVMLSSTPTHTAPPARAV